MARPRLTVGVAPSPLVTLLDAVSTLFFLIVIVYPLTGSSPPSYRIYCAQPVPVKSPLDSTLQSTTTRRCSLRVCVLVVEWEWPRSSLMNSDNFNIWD